MKQQEHYKLQKNKTLEVESGEMEKNRAKFKFEDLEYRNDERVQLAMERIEGKVGIRKS